MTLVLPVRHRQRPWWWRSTLAVLLAATLVLLGVAPGTKAASAGEQIRPYRASYTLSKDGSVRVEIEFGYTFGEGGGHGPFLTVPVQVATKDPAKDRLYPISDIVASSPSGAPAQVRTKLRHGVEWIYIGDPHTTVHGTQTYRVTYTQAGVINHLPDHDEFYWNVLSGWSMWIIDATAVVHAPGAAQTVACYQGELGSTSPCAEATTTLAADQSEGWALPSMAKLKVEPGDAAFWNSLTPTGQHFTINVTYPKGTFPNSPVYSADPADRTRYVFEWDAWTMSIAIGGGAILFALLTWLGRAVVGRIGGKAARARRLAATVPAGTSFGAGPTDSPFLARSQPPADVRPGEVSLLSEGRPGEADLSATLADLAQRGVIEMAPADPPGLPTGDDVSAQIARAVLNALGKQDWRFTRRPAHAGLAPSRAERALLETLFASGDTVTLRALSPLTLTKVRRAMNRGAIADVVAKHWFRPGFRLAQRSWAFFILALLLVAASTVGAGFVESTWGLGPWFIGTGGCVVAALLFAVALRRPTPRTRTGAETFTELESFREYLAQACSRHRTVEAADAGFAPYAIAFGLAAPFAVVTEDLASSGRGSAEYPWWLFMHTGASSVSAAATPPSSSSGGSSGASGGSGSSGSGSAGGGGGGTGGGGW